MPAPNDSPLCSQRAFCVLLALADGDAHGYAIAKSVEASSGGALRLSPGTLYPLIRQMLADGWIAEVSIRDEDPRRRSYRLTARGRRVAQAEAERLADLVRVARSRRLLPSAALV